MSWWHPPLGMAAACREIFSGLAAAGTAAAAGSSAAAGASAAAAAGAAATTGAAAAGTTASTISAISTAATIASTVAGIATSLAAANQQAAAQRGMAANAQFQADQEAIRGQQQANQLRENLLRTLAAQRTRFAASGLAPDEGTALTLQEEAQRDAERELGILDANTTIRSEQQRRQAGVLSDAADFTEMAGTVRAGANLFDAFDRYTTRQPGRTRR